MYFMNFYNFNFLIYKFLAKSTYIKLCVYMVTLNFNIDFVFCLFFIKKIK